MSKPKYTHEEYPSFRFRHNPEAEGGYDSVIVKSKAEDANLDDDWYDSPQTAREMAEALADETVTDEPKVAEKAKGKPKGAKAKGEPVAE